MSTPSRPLAITLATGLAAILVAAPAYGAQPLTMKERLDCQARLDGVKYEHWNWPAANPGPKPPIGQLLPESGRRAKIDDSARQAQALNLLWGVQIAPHDAQDELNRMAARSQDPARLREYFAALGNDPTLLAQCLAQPVLTERALRRRYSEGVPENTLKLAARPGQSFEAWWHDAQTAFEPEISTALAETNESFSLPEIPQVPAAGCNTWTPTVWAPEKRTGHSAVWTGTEMIIYGGRFTEGGINYYLNTGGRYNPATDSWTMLPYWDVDGSYQHTAVWTGTRMYIWGGLNSDTTLHGVNVGAYFTPGTGLWTITSASGAPAARFGHTATWTVGLIVVWGGNTDPTGAATGVTNTGGIFNPGTSVWTATSLTGSVPSARDEHGAAETARLTLGTDMTIWGGRVAGGGYTNTGARFDVSGNTWISATPTAGAPVARGNHVVIATVQGKMAVWGGRTSLITPLTNTGAVYDMEANTWTTMTTTGAPTNRENHTGIYDSVSGTVTIWGGHLAVGYTATGGRYSLSGNSWTATDTADADRPSSRSNHTAVWTGTEMIVWGGNNGTGALDDGGRFNPAGADFWKPVSQSIPLPRYYHRAVWTGTEMVLWGGKYSDGVATAYLGKGFRYTPATGVWLPITATGEPTGRISPSAVWTGTEMVIWGGSNASGNPDDGAIYSPSGNSWRAMAAGAALARTGHSTIWTGTEMIIWGGQDSANTYLRSGARYHVGNDQWTDTGVNWAPSARKGHSAVWTGSEMIVWGGEDGSFFINTGGLYNPLTDAWSASGTATSGAPVARANHNAEFDGAAMWICNGMTTWGGARTNTCAAYRPQLDNWITVSSTATARDQAASIWTGGEMLVWGGQSTATGRAADGTRLAPPAGPIAMASAGAPMPAIGHSGVWTGAQFIVWGGLPGSNNFSNLSTGGMYELNPPPPAITTQPAAGNRCTGGSRNFIVAASGAGLTYQWMKDSANLSNGGGYTNVTSATMSLTAATPSHSGRYQAAVKNSCTQSLTRGVDVTIYGSAPASPGNSLRAAKSGAYLALDWADSPQTDEYQITASDNPAIEFYAYTSTPSNFMFSPTFPGVSEFINIYAVNLCGGTP